MPWIENMTRGKIRFLTGQSLNPGFVTDEVSEAWIEKNKPWINGKFRSGALKLHQSKPPAMPAAPGQSAPTVETEDEVPGVTRTAIRQMDDEKLDELLNKFGKDTSGNLTEKRERLIEAMFSDGV